MKIIPIFRSALLGKAKFDAASWNSIIATIWEQRSLETIKGVRMALIHALCRATWGTERPMEDPRTDHFTTSVRRIIRQIIELVPDQDISNQLKEMMAYYDPSHKNDRRYMEGRLEQIRRNPKHFVCSSNEVVQLKA